MVRIEISDHDHPMSKAQGCKAQSLMTEPSCVVAMVEVCILISLIGINVARYAISK